MFDLNQWAIKHNIPYQAVHELRAGMGVYDFAPIPNATGSEAKVQANVSLEASQAGARLWRNNVGACKDDRGNFIRYGLCNESKRMNESLKSSDLIGVTPVEITYAMVGGVIGQFTAREAKPENWTYSGTPREKAQLKYMMLVLSLGGNASFVTGPGTF